MSHATPPPREPMCDLALADGALQLELADDGRGFDAERATEKGHHGLGNMRARVDGAGRHTDRGEQLRLGDPYHRLAYPNHR